VESFWRVGPHLIHMSHLKRGSIFLCFLGLPVFAESPVPGIKNLHAVDEHVFRGAQPTSEGIQYLVRNGVRTVIDLRETDERSSAEAGSVIAAGMRYVNVPMTGMVPPTETEMAKILQLLEDHTTGPVFVHCKRGADRTGAVIAAYRIHHDHWENDRALREAMSSGMSIFQYPRRNYIRTFQQATIEAKTIGQSSTTARHMDSGTTDSATALAVPVAH
jgi:tyrosine-protein phosphatase SIW14